MHLCRLHHRDRPHEEIEARLIGEGDTTLGRDPDADWTLDDPDATLSRIHCLLREEQGRLLVLDRSRNGVFLGEARVAADAPAPLAPGDILRLGEFLIRVEAAPGAVARPQAAAAPARSPPRRAPSPPREADLLEAFCEGAGLDASALAGEEPAEVMRRVGAVYRETVAGLGELMRERTRLKRDRDLDRTTISAADNNPFKWTASPGLAEELLCGRHDGFLSDAAAVRASFEDLAAHLAALASSADAGAGAVLRALAPDAIEAEARAQGSLLRGRASLCWDVLVRRHAGLCDAAPPEGGAIRRAVGQAYVQAPSRAAAAPGEAPAA